MSGTARWLFGAAMLVLGLSAVGKVLNATMPQRVREAYDDPTTIYFWPVETYGKECADMVSIAKARGAKHWVCYK